MYNDELQQDINKITNMKEWVITGKMIQKPKDAEARAKEKGTVNGACRL